MGLQSRHNDDLEYGSGYDGGHAYADKTGVYVNEAPAVTGESFTYGNSTYAKIQRFAGRFNIEQRGIERVPEDERTDSSLVKVGTMVCSAIFGISNRDGSMG